MPVNPTFFAEETREEIVRSILNASKSKATWTFSKQKRFLDNKATNDNVSYLGENKFIIRNSGKGNKFSQSNRKVFTEVTESPFSWKYSPKTPETKRFPTMAEGREECKHKSYLDDKLASVPGPGSYEIKEIKSKGNYSMRPKTGHSRTYFIENKESMEVPGPGRYIDENPESITKKTITSKFRSSSLGCSGLMSRTKRFQTDSENDKKIHRLGTSLYDGDKRSWSRGCVIGNQKRKSWIDSTVKSTIQAGPGNYQLPSEFGHYKAMDKMMRMTH